ncbi:putative transposase [Caballeronia arvi]|uniref:Transposase n=1 Tax=Caballeronia arvi TaxID=1777135 RepID=A0A158L3A2_9BURK|nr:putative transposase [Caballeronia arvi]
MLPLSPGLAESHGFEYKRNGKLSFFAAFDTATGEVFRKTVLRQTSEPFVAFLTDVAPVNPNAEKSTSAVTISSKTERVADSSTLIATYVCTSRRPTRRGSTKWKTGSRASSMM